MNEDEIRLLETPRAMPLLLGVAAIVLAGLPLVVEVKPVTSTLDGALRLLPMIACLVGMLWHWGARLRTVDGTVVLESWKGFRGLPMRRSQVLHGAHSVVISSDLVRVRGGRIQVYPVHVATLGERVKLVAPADHDYSFSLARRAARMMGVGLHDQTDGRVWSAEEVGAPFWETERLAQPGPPPPSATSRAGRRRDRESMTFTFPAPGLTGPRTRMFLLSVFLLALVGGVMAMLLALRGYEPENRSVYEVFVLFCLLAIFMITRSLVWPTVRGIAVRHVLKATREGLTLEQRALAGVSRRTIPAEVIDLLTVSEGEALGQTPLIKAPHIRLASKDLCVRLGEGCSPAELRWIVATVKQQLAGWRKAGSSADDRS